MVGALGLLSPGLGLFFDMSALPGRLFDGASLRELAFVVQVVHDPCEDRALAGIGRVAALEGSSRTRSSNPPLAPTSPARGRRPCEARGCVGGLGYRYPCSDSFRQKPGRAYGKNTPEVATPRTRLAFV